MKDKLFKEFPEVSPEQWKQQIEADLKGADYDKLFYKSLHGVDVKPFYHSGDLKGSFPVSPPGSWNVCEKIYVDSAEEANQKSIYALEKGAESLWFVIPSEEISLEKLFKGIDLQQTPIYISLEFLSEEYFRELQNFLKDRSTQIFLQIDILGNLARTGNWFHSAEKDHEILKSLASSSKGFTSVVAIDSTLYQNAGANIPQELAYSLAHLNEYLNYFEEGKVALENFQPQFLVASGTNYFFEIAKIRALRWLYTTLAKKYNLPETCHILAQPTRRDKTLYDFNVNLLRSTTEGMSAVLGGANAVYNPPYDSIFHKSNKFGDRIARNQLLVMKNEAYFDKVANAAAGTYFIEKLTRDFAEAALKIFKEIENAGGFLKQLKEGYIQQEIQKSAEREQEKFDKGELILIGSNKFANPQDKMQDELELDPFLRNNPKNPVVEPILEHRLSEKLEQERLKKEKAV